MPEAVRGGSSFRILFVVDIWERFSFYGMQAILYLYLVADRGDGGVGLSASAGAAIFGAYLALVFAAALPGGWLCDRVLGAAPSTMYGGVLVMLGHLLLAVPATVCLPLGLVAIVAGTGLIKPAMLSMIGGLHPEGRGRREAAFSFFYMSIQVSAILAPLLVGFLGERVNWHLGFACAGVGMGLGVVTFAAGRRHFAEADTRPRHPVAPEAARPVVRRAGTVVLVAVAAVVAVVSAAGPRAALALVALGLILAPFLAYHSLMRAPEMTDGHRHQLRALRWLLLSAALFWGLYAQSGSVLSQFTHDHVRRGMGGFTVPVSWFLAAHPFFLLVLAPAFGWLWLHRGRLVPPVPKVAAGLLLMGVSFLVMLFAALQARSGPVGPVWLVGVYLLQVCGELSLAPILLSLCAEVGPPGHGGRLIGLFWLFSALGAGVFGQVAQAASVAGAGYYLGIAVVTCAAAVGLAVAARALDHRLPADVQRPSAIPVSQSFPIDQEVA